ncbi:MAG: Coagulation factor protein, partial [Candidatus Andersenbacteria bacterium CG10_big_fil_rev_8_21_14_0_10_54_11]
MTVSHNAAGSPATISVSGKGTAPVLALSATSLIFSDAQVNTSGTRTLTISNAGDADLHIAGIASSDTSFTASPPSFTVNPNNSQAVTVTFRPLAIGPKSGALTIAHDAAGSPST